MSNRAWMPLHIADYLADTGHLTAAEHGAYLLLIMHYWQNGSLPENERLIARIARLDASQWEESRDVIAMLFGHGWTHKRIDAELSKADDIIEKRRAAADARHGKRKPDASAMQMQSKCSDTGALPTTDNQEHVGSDEPTSSEPDKSAPSVIDLPCVSGDPFPVFEADIAEWEQSFPAVDVRQQLGAMRSWLKANPKRAKTKRGMRKFVVSWLDRRQNAGTQVPSPQARGSPPKPKSDFDVFRDYVRSMDDEQGNSQGDRATDISLRLVAGHGKP